MLLLHSSLSSVLALALGTGLAQAQYLINELSFGYAGTMGKDGTVPNFVLAGSQQPEVLSNKLILTPVAPGNQRAAIWTDNKLMHSTWIADLDFRATGPERGSGNLNIWLTAGGRHEIGTNSAYTVGRFDGLVLVIDTQGQGMVRGYLNDRTADFSARSDVPALAFGHCQYSYRNLGRPSQVKMRQTANKFAVEIDGRPCFETDKVKMPIGYQFGVTAASADTPDSFEVFKFVVMSENLHPEGSFTQQQAGSNQRAVGNEAPPSGNNQQQQQQQQGGGGSGGFFSGQSGQATHDPDAPVDQFEMADRAADSFKSSEEQFADLHNRLQGMTHQISNVFRTVSKHSRASDLQKTDLSRLLEALNTQVLPKLERISYLEGKVGDLEREVKAMRGDVNLQVKNSERALKASLGEHHRILSSSFADAVPGHGKLITVIVGSQIVAAVGYYLYKRRRANMPKKYL